MHQRSAEWHAARLGCVGGSSIADVLATTKTGEAASRANLRARLVAERLTGRMQESYTNAAMLHGIETEPEARAVYEATCGVIVEETGWHPHPTIRWAGASPDGLVGDDGVLEIKCPQSAAHIETLLARKVPSKYIPQVQWQMACSGRRWVDFASYDPRMPAEHQLWVCRVERDDTRIAQMEEAVRVFLAEVDEVVRRLT